MSARHRASIMNALVAAFRLPIRPLTVFRRTLEW